MTSKCLSIAGFDGSGGAGLQADLKTFSAFGCYGVTVLSALPIQNTCGVKRCYEIPLESIQDQLEAIFEDIVPDCIKIGMLFSTPIIKVVSDFLEKHASRIPIVLDPVMVAKSGDALLQTDAVLTLKSRLIPLATLITPNLPEAFTLVGETEDMQALTKQLLRLGSQSVLLKGGHAEGPESNDLFIDNTGAQVQLLAKKIDTKNTHGTGCTLSAAICACLALGFTPLQACQYAKNYLSNAMLAAQHLSIGKGHGPVHHFYHIRPSSLILSLQGEIIV
jgi:hydroxymethylpyrimidine/phosphomethylpyrimidine kinase